MPNSTNSLCLDDDAIVSDIKGILDRFAPHDESRSVYDYALFPTGKLFRPKLVWAVALDGGGLTPNHRLFATSLELHHAYTLLHDDLPCMDDDDTRRGKPSTHLYFNEWKALLAGDGLINLGYRVLGEIDHAQSRLLLKIFSHCLGPKGLILGQYRDLLRTPQEPLDKILEIGALKTAKLIQCALVGSTLLNDRTTFRVLLDEARLGFYLGVLFQLLDDLSECIHEDDKFAVNPWPRAPLCCLAECKRLLLAISRRTTRRRYLTSVLEKYFYDLTNALKNHRHSLEDNIALDLAELLEELEYRA